MSEPTTDPVIVDPTEPNCDDIYYSDEALKTETMFDNDRGSIYLIGANDCAEQKQEVFKVKNEETEKKKEKKEEKDKKKRAKSEEKKKNKEEREEKCADGDLSGSDCDSSKDSKDISDVSSMSSKELSDISEYDEYNEMVFKYTDGYSMVSGWEWEPEEVGAGESAGVCVVDDLEEQFASCWLLIRNDADTAWASESSFLIDPSYLNENLKLEDYIGDKNPSTGTGFDVTNGLYTGYFGSWVTGKLYNEDGMDNVTCTRFLPREEKSAKADYRYQQGGKIHVYTYMSSRVPEDQAAPVVSATPTQLLEKEALGPQMYVTDPISAFGGWNGTAFGGWNGTFTEDGTQFGRLQMFSVELSGSVSNFAVASLATAVSMLALSA